MPFIDSLALQPQEKDDIREFARRNPAAFKAKDVDEATEKVKSANEILEPLRRLRAPGEAKGPVQEHASLVYAGVRGEFLWPRGKIPFEIAAGTAHEKLIRDAMDHWCKKTKGRITFVDRDKNTNDYVCFQVGDGCASQWVGRMGGMQLVFVSDDCEIQQLIHELGHVIGLFHEQNRRDRGDKIQLIEDNVLPDYVAQFKRSISLREDKARDFGTFDWKSIMLYPPRAFTKDGKPTLRKLEPPGDESWGLKVDERQGGVTVELSEGDVAGVEELYRQAKTD